MKQIPQPSHRVFTVSRFDFWLILAWIFAAGFGFGWLVHALIIQF